jgi:hypothetical protein
VAALVDTTVLVYRYDSRFLDKQRQALELLPPVSPAMRFGCPIKRCWS